MVFLWISSKTSITCLVICPTLHEFTSPQESFNFMQFGWWAKSRALHVLSCGCSTGPILMTFPRNVLLYVAWICCTFGEFWLGGTYLKLVRNIANCYEITHASQMAAPSTPPVKTSHHKSFCQVTQTSGLQFAHSMCILGPCCQCIATIS